MCEYVYVDQCGRPKEQVVMCPPQSRHATSGLAADTTTRLRDSPTILNTTFLPLSTSSSLPAPSHVSNSWMDGSGDFAPVEDSVHAVARARRRPVNGGYQISPPADEPNVAVANFFFCFPPTSMCNMSCSESECADLLHLSRHPKP